jgi:hypothetical protein
MKTKAKTHRKAEKRTVKRKLQDDEKTITRPSNNANVVVKAGARLARTSRSLFQEKERHEKTRQGKARQGSTTQQNTTQDITAQHDTT